MRAEYKGNVVHVGEFDKARKMVLIISESPLEGFEKVLDGLGNATYQRTVGADEIRKI